MRQTEAATQEMWDAYNAAHAQYERDLAQYSTLGTWKRLTTRKPSWNPTAPGFYVVTVYHYYDRTEQEPLRSEPGDWAFFAFDHVNVPDYSQAWYDQRDRQQREQEAAQRQVAGAVYRANAGAAYYQSDQPWSWQRDPSRY